MYSLETWLTTRGPDLAATLDAQREQICEQVSLRLATTFPILCYDPARVDALRFQRFTFYEVPRRFHRVLQVLLVFQYLEVIEQEYRWAWKILMRYGVAQHHLLAQVRWYFEAVRTAVPLDTNDRILLDVLEASILRTIENVTEF